MNKQSYIYVYAHWLGMHDPVHVGTVTRVQTGTGEALSFEYDAGWLRSNHHVVLDAQLQNYSGAFFPSGRQDSFGMLYDSSPGSWGEMLLRKNEMVQARKEKRPATELFSSDFLLSVFDYYRSGALRFKLAPDAEFITGDEQYLLPTFGNLRDLENACGICETHTVNDPEFIRSIDFLAPAACALRGKRPKANVIDDEWQMWIAKFPSVRDTYDVGAWEYVVHTLAGLAGIQTSQAVMKRLGSQHHTFITQRFDRTARGERIHCASATTLLGFSPGDEQRMSVSYLSLVGFLMRHGADVNKDLQELWRRIVFNIAVRNTDDHLGNHGFLLTDQGWKLAPAFDMNPQLNATGLTLNISESDNALEYDLALSVAHYFRVKPDKAKSILTEVRVAAKQWNKIAGDSGISKAEQERMASAFER